MERIFPICVLCITAVSASSAQPEELYGVVGQEVPFPTSVRNSGGLSYSGTDIGDVTHGQFTPLPNEKFTGRVQWDSSTGFFSITGLKMEDSGRYRVKNDANLDTVYQLTVFIPVSKPKVSHDKHSCTLYCTVDRGTEVTLSWYREGEKENFISSDSLNAPYVKLPEAVERSGTYTCEAVNPISRERSSVTVGEECAGYTGPHIGLVIGLICTSAAALIFAGLYCRQRILQKRRPE
ncbi:hypothetical protein AGOR_G00195550 [Albula goreensis]|uniref:Ig-like domain-containing protein n=1 Tax=Albula goreensis TaxID=1534307 RepID=A0A8T3CRM2_9TELE|nr:hypothetical protein AGOR_G00195550 [Albula goreensis]